MSSQIGRVSGKPTGGNPGFPAGVKNGRIPLALLGRCETQTHAAHPLLYKPAAVAFDQMTRMAKQQGVTIEAVALYRDLDGQRRMKADWTAKGKPNNAAAPGTSPHGWGTAADINRYLPGVLDWLKRNATRYGWDSPLWAMDGTGTEEPWHWQYIQGFELPAIFPEVPVYVAGKLIPDADAYRDEGLVMAAVRPIAEAAGWEVASRAKTPEGKEVIHLLHGAQAQTSVSYELRGDRAFVPVRELCRALGMSCLWDAATQSVKIG